jgi:hypothetical protein
MSSGSLSLAGQALAMSWTSSSISSAMSYWSSISFWIYPKGESGLFSSASIREKYSDTDLHGSTQIRLLDRFRSSKNYQPFVQEWQSSENRRQITTRD